MLDKHDLPTEVADKLEPNLVQLGFRRAGKHRFTRTEGEAKQALGLVWRFPKQRTEPLIFLTPYVHVTFAGAKKIADMIRGGKMKDLPTVGGAIGVFSPKGSLIEWPVDNDGYSGPVAESIWRAVKDWAVPFWAKYNSLQAVIAAAESEDTFTPRLPHWEDMAGIHYTAGGVRSALNYVSHLPASRVSDAARGRAMGVLNALERGD
jgi:hypothetical protein